MFLKWFKPQISDHFNFSSIVEYNPTKNLFCLVQGIVPKSCLGPSKGRSIGNNNDKVNISRSDRDFLLSTYLSDARSLEKFLLKRNITVPSWVPRLINEASVLVKKDSAANQNSALVKDDDEDDTEQDVLQMSVGSR